MKIVIDIPEKLYEAYKGRPPMLGDAGMDMIAQSIANGTPLPKGHYIQKGLMWECSNCGAGTRIMKKYNIPNFCPCCGADMREADKEVDHE